MPTRIMMSDHPTAVPVELCGKWVAWNADHARIVAHADTLELLWLTIRQQRISDSVFEKVPRADVRFVGTR